MPDVVPSEFSSGTRVIREESMAVEGIRHPITGSERHFILGDRFHNTVNPHKSPLCAFHDVNLCSQAFTLTTSTQESENNRKNKQRLRSTCQQSFEVHYLFNYLMDFYINESIAKQQKKTIQKSIGPDKVVKRNSMGRFVIVEK